MLLISSFCVCIYSLVIYLVCSLLVSLCVIVATIASIYHLSDEDNKKYEKSSSGSLKEFAPEKKGMNYNYSLLYNKITGINFKDFSEMGEKYFEENESFRDIKFKGIILFIFLNFYFYF